jgi:hypothetical protein
MESRPPNVEGKGAVTQRDCLRNALRMRPDRIIVGETRGEEVIDMLQAMNTGHDGSMTTIHANSARDGISRLENMVAMAGIEMPLKAVRSQIASAVNLIVQASRLQDGSRRMTSITEITGMEGDVIYMQEVFRYQRVGLTPDNKIIITPKYMGLMESGMIGRVLNVPAWLDRKKVGIIIDGERHVLKQNGSLTLSCEGECLSVHEKEVVYSHYVNRKASNIVRAQYSGFMKYFGGFLSLRKDVDGRDIRMSMMEIADNIGYEYKERGVWQGGRNQGRTEQVWQPALESVKLMEFKPQGYRCLGLVRNSAVGGDKANPYGDETLWSAYTRQCKSFFAAISDDQPEEGKVDNYYRMTLTLLALSMPYTHRNPLVGEDMLVDIPVSAVERMLDKIMMQWHSEEMIEKRPLKPNQLPNDKYEAYITKMPTEEEIKRISQARQPQLSSDQ